ncbi:hypothetical protein JTB14_032743 [Gonioctena quinquepunctata]|nr:hypothetical protein JTB14_032743 [Gonioctena quinquepunctata]
MTGDPLELLLALSGFQYFRDINRFRKYCFLFGSFHIFFDMMAIYESLLSENINRSCLVGVFMHSPVGYESYIHTPPAWSITLPISDLSLSELGKNTVNPRTIRIHFSTLLEKYKSYHHIYTDASKTESGVAAAFISFRIPTISTIYTGELFAIPKALEYANEKNIDKCNHGVSECHIRIESTIPQPSNISADKEGTLLSPNEKSSTACDMSTGARRKGRQRCSRQTSTGNHIPRIEQTVLSDTRAYIRQKVTNKWQQEWDRSNAKLEEIKQSVLPRKTKFKCRRDEVTITLVLVPKPDGSIRLCVNYQALNGVTISDKYPLPRIDDLLHTAKQTPFMTTLDMKSGYHQISVRPMDRDKTAFICPFGIYRYNGMPFGLENAPSIFQRLVDRFISGLPGVTILAYLDDLIILSESFEKHLQRSEMYKLRLNRAKCIFVCPVVKYLGHPITPHGIEPDPNKLRAILERKPPTDVKQVMSFIKTCSWFRHFIENFANVSRPSTSLLKKNAKWVWGTDQQNSFDRLKELLTSTPILRQADVRIPYVLRTDSSSYALGASLSVILSMVIHLEKFTIYKEELRTDCFQIDSGGEKVKRKILNESMAIKIFCVLLLVSCVSIHLTFSPFIGDEDKFLCQFKVPYAVFGRYFSTIIIMITLAVEGWIILFDVCVAAHIIFQLRFQFLLLNEYVGELEKSGNVLVMHDTEYQEFVYQKLRQCVKHHIKIKR